MRKNGAFSRVGERHVLQRVIGMGRCVRTESRSFLDGVVDEIYTTDVHEIIYTL